MKLSLPIYGLKRKAKRLVRKDGIPLHEALDKVAAAEGYARWSLLAARLAAASPAPKLLARMRAGDLVLVGARPRQGKTRLGLELAGSAATAGRDAAFFSLACTQAEARDGLEARGFTGTDLQGRFTFDGSDAIDANHIVACSRDMPSESVVVVDYLQVLDHRRSAPDLEAQVRALKALAKTQGATVILLSQISRSYDPARKPFPDLGDVRLPNPLDLALFDATCFLNAGAARFERR